MLRDLLWIISLIFSLSFAIIRYFHEIKPVAERICDDGKCIKTYTIPTFLYSGDVITHDADHLTQLGLCQVIGFPHLCDSSADSLPFLFLLHHSSPSEVMV